VITASPTVYQVEVRHNKSYTVRLNSAVPIWESREPEIGSIDITCTCVYSNNYLILCKHAIAVLREARADPNNYYDIVTWYSIDTYRNTYSHPMEPIQLKDFKHIQLYISDDEYGSDNPFKERDTA
jgi:hypothetical protein